MRTKCILSAALRSKKILQQTKVKNEKAIINFTSIIIHAIFSALADTANLEDLEKACNASDGTACESIAKAYELGTNVETNFDKANIYHQKACELNIGVGCYNLIQDKFLQNGVNSPKNTKKLKELFNKA